MKDDEIIAEFMNLIHRKVIGPLTANEYIEVKLYDRWVICKYDSSWEWLMNVVEKIEDMGYKTTLFCHEYGKEDGNSMHIKDGSHTMLGDGFASTKIEAVYKAVVEFIKWYNENKKA